MTMLEHDNTDAERPSASWNRRVVRHADGSLAIHEVRYGPDGTVRAWTESCSEAVDREEGLDGLAKSIEFTHQSSLDATAKPILDASDLPGGGDGESCEASQEAYSRVRAEIDGEAGKKLAEAESRLAALSATNAFLTAHTQRLIDRLAGARMMAGDLSIEAATQFVNAERGVIVRFSEDRSLLPTSIGEVARRDRQRYRKSSAAHGRSGSARPVACWRRTQRPIYRRGHRLASRFCARSAPRAWPRLGRGSAQHR
jgi:hypothetical protein